ncbi:metallophosphoesterase [Desulfovibrio inopinatus]|uniref:metallophosphoesterase n=1 Tax=Desulfovibrio inopinatus TaxID=102109 RepID=UPI000401D094|nr:metallophosphoesterase [Desulfovibrio inopinatus]
MIPQWDDAEVEMFERLALRIGLPHLRSRLRLQIKYAAKMYGGLGRVKFHLENIDQAFVVLRLGLQCCGLFNLGQQNCLNVIVRHVDHVFDDLPVPFHEFTLLHLSDLHLDALPDRGDRLIAEIGRIQADIGVLTGDYRFLTHDEYRTSMELMHRLSAELPASTFAVLGNHDAIEMVAPLESFGIRVLLNEHEIIDRDGSQICLAGVDDPHFYGADDLHKALFPDPVFTVLLAHSPELYEDAAIAGVKLYLCGHTHGGQICLPGGVPIMTNAACPRQYTRGRWQHRKMIGYTSSGAGASGLPVRYFCPPEITVHRLFRS